MNLKIILVWAFFANSHTLQVRMSEVDSKKVANRYLKREVLGEGTYGVVYKAIDTKVSTSESGFDILSFFSAVFRVWFGFSVSWTFHELDFFMWV